MKIIKDEILLDRHFPFSISPGVMAPGFNMGGIHHWHECLEISYVKSGRGRYYIEDKVYEMQPGDIIIINNIEPHYLEVYEEEMEQPVITFEPSLVWSYSGLTLDYEYLKPFFERGTDFNNKLDLNNPFSAEIMIHLNAIEQECKIKAEGHHLMIKARLLMILTYLLRYFRDRDKANVDGFSKRQLLTRLEDVLRYIGENYHHDIRLDDAASMLYVSPQYFSSFFKKATGSTFSDYLSNIRINNAIRLLKETDKKITHIAAECGFNNTTNFNNIFKKFTGRTPSDYR